MLQTEQTLFEQMRITELEIESRKALFSFTGADVKALQSFKPIIEENIDKIVDDFYGLQTSVSEIALLIGDSTPLPAYVPHREDMCSIYLMVFMILST
nr:protoglobin domain-containing protein [Shewanella baltica]